MFALLYEELRAIARQHRRRWHGDFTLDTTALVHETYLRLAAREPMGVDRAHFVAIAGRVMRHVLSNYARDRRRQKRGGGYRHVTLDDEPPAAVSDTDLDTVGALDDLLRVLETREPRRVRIVECRFFAGMSIEETAETLGISPATVKREWALARAWLYRQLRNAHDTDAPVRPTPDQAS